MFFMGEYAKFILFSAMIVSLLFGGWTLPWFGLDQPARRTCCTACLEQIRHLHGEGGRLFMVGFIWVRWMWPRFRYDQLMDLGWRRFIPAGAGERY